MRSRQRKPADSLHPFRAPIDGALQGLVTEAGQKVIKKVLAAIDTTVEESLNQALQTAPEQVAVKLDVDEPGHL